MLLHPARPKERVVTTYSDATPNGQRTSSAVVERDPWFRALTAITLLTITAVLLFDFVHGRGGTPAAPSSSSTAMSGMTSGSAETMTAEQMAAMHKASMVAFPAKTAGLGNQVLQPQLVNGVKVFHLMAMPVRWEVTPGQFVTAFAYNGQVPGPQIRVSAGDRIRVILTNHLTQPTTIHWHGMTVPNSMDGVPYVTQDPVMPGKTFTYQFTVEDPPGTYLYHSHFNSTEQVGNGLYGSLVVEPKRATWDTEYTEILNDGTLGFDINGKGWPATAPIAATKGQTILIRLANVGQMLHPMHMHGYHFSVVAQDGSAVTPYTADTLVVAPGETYDVLVHATIPGVWAFHCHILSHVEGPQGMYGMATALVVK